MQTYSRYEARPQAADLLLLLGHPFNLLVQPLGTVAALLLVHGVPVAAGHLLVLVAQQEVRRDVLLLPAADRQHLPGFLRQQTVHQYHLIPSVFGSGSTWNRENFWEI